MADAIFKQIDLIIDNDINNAHFHIRVIKQVAARILHRNNNPSDFQQNLDQYYVLHITDSKLYRQKPKIKNHYLKAYVLSIFKSKLLSASNSLKYLTNLIL